MSSYIESLWPLRAHPHPEKPGVLQLAIGFQDWKTPCILGEQEIFDKYRTPWPALVRTHPRLAPRILKKIAAANLVPEAVSYVLLSLGSTLQGSQDARAVLPIQRAHLARLKRRTRAFRRALEFLKPTPTDTPVGPAVSITIQTEGQPLYGVLESELEGAIAFDTLTTNVLERDPPRGDVGLFLEFTLFRLDAKPLELACILQHHPDALRVLFRPGTRLPETAIEIAEWIRMMTTRSRKRPGTRPSNARRRNATSQRG